MTATPHASTSTEVRAKVVSLFRRDLIGPTRPEDVDLAEERLSVSPSAWYLTGFLVPADDASATTASEEDDVEAQAGLFDQLGAAEASVTGVGDGGGDDQADPAPARRAFMPSSMGLTVMLPIEVESVEVEVTWGDYRPEPPQPPEMFDPERAGDGKRPHVEWVRVPRMSRITVPLDSFTGDARAGGRLRDIPLLDSKPVVARNGLLEIAGHWRFYDYAAPDGSREQVRVLTIAVVNKRNKASRGLQDASYTFQTTLTVHCPQGFAPQRDYADYNSKDPDRRLADLHYRDVCHYGTGRNCAVAWTPGEDGKVRTVRTELFPEAEVARVAANEAIEDVTFGMVALADLARDSAEGLKAALSPLPAAYAKWIGQQQKGVVQLPGRRAEVARDLLEKAGLANGRIEEGIARITTDPRARLAFEIMNRAIEAAARRREEKVETWNWRPFQLAFILLNLPGLADKTDPDREIVDLLFFPTGGGKTEAYFGLIAFMIAYRRLGAGGVLGAGVTAIMRYTLRLLTIDQLTRAAGVICALELARDGPDYRDAAGKPLLGTWPIEIGLWIGGGGSPNRLGGPGVKDPENKTAVNWLERYKKGRAGPPAPIEDCPWCRTPLTKDSFSIFPNKLAPADLELRCVNDKCEFQGARKLPVIVVDDAIYRRLPALIISTVDKFAALPWEGRTGAFFCHVDRHDERGFYGAAEPGGGQPLDSGYTLDPPDLIIQDELHLISGPLGTVAGLYETAVEQLCLRQVGGKTVKPKIVASTATVRRAEAQIRALFDRDRTEIFPPPGPDREDSFFAKTLAVSAENPGRLYLGVAAQGRGPKLVFLRGLTSVLAAATAEWDRLDALLKSPAGEAAPFNPADPYVTALCYFNALRELGGARRIVEDEVKDKCGVYGDQRIRLQPASSPFSNRVVSRIEELTSRVPTHEVSATRKRLGEAWRVAKDAVDVALATNMISVGLDITRLGLMVVQGQPKMSAEYIQATSRVGRDARRPGLVMTMLNLHKPRDRMHYEQFAAFHGTFYRSVEATSVTPWSSRALERALAPVVVSLARHLSALHTPNDQAKHINQDNPALAGIAQIILDRASGEPTPLTREELEDEVKSIVLAWQRIIAERGGHGSLSYAVGRGGKESLMHDPLHPNLQSTDFVDYRRFAAGRSMRDVEHTVPLDVRQPNGARFKEDPSA
jgi:hypothetical protein